MDYEKEYKEALEKAKAIYQGFYKPDTAAIIAETLQSVFPELRESEDKKIRKEIIGFLRNIPNSNYTCEEMAAWLEKQGSEPNWCHHKVDLSNCSEEYRKAYYDGWNNCNMQHSQCKSESNDVVKCLINGMRFYYEDNEEATWGTEKFSMKVKDILSWLEKQGEPKQEWSEEDERIKNNLLSELTNLSVRKLIEKETEKKYASWLKSLRPQSQWKPSNEQIEALDFAADCIVPAEFCFKRKVLKELLEQLKKL